MATTDWAWCGFYPPNHSQVGVFANASCVDTQQLRLRPSGHFDGVLIRCDYFAGVSEKDYGRARLAFACSRIHQEYGELLVMLCAVEEFRLRGDGAGNPDGQVVVVEPVRISDNHGLLS